MLSEFLVKLAEQSVAAAAPQIKEADPTKVYAVRGPDGTIKFTKPESSRRDHKAQDLETIVAFADKNSAPAIWYSRNQITLLANDDERFDRVTVQMLKSAQVLRLIQLDSNRPLLPQRDFLFMLRTVFTPNAFPTAPKLIDTLRQVKFETGSKTEGNIQRGKTSVGKEAMAAATFLDVVPEQVTLSVPLFDNRFANRSYDVICALEVFEVEQKLQLFPLPGEIEKAFSAAEADLSKDLRDLLGSDVVPVYFGQP